MDPLSTYSWFEPDVRAATLVFKTIVRKVLWEFDSNKMQNLSDILHRFVYQHVRLITWVQPKSTLHLATRSLGEWVWTLVYFLFTVGAKRRSQMRCPCPPHMELHRRSRLLSKPGSRHLCLFTFLPNRARVAYLRAKTGDLLRGGQGLFLGGGDTTKNDFNLVSCFFFFISGG